MSLIVTLEGAHVSGDGNQKLISYSGHGMCHKPHHSTVYASQSIPQKGPQHDQGLCERLYKKFMSFTTN